MTGDNTVTPIPLSKKLSVVTHHHLLTRVPIKLDLDDWHYWQWDYFFVQLCESYDVDKYLFTPTTESNTSSSAPLTPEELKVDKIMLSWILFTLSDSLRARVVVARPKSAKEAWSLISDIVKDNKRSRTNTLKAELRSIKLGDHSMESYFQKIDSIVNILTSLDARVNEEDVVHYALEGLPDTYNQVYGYMHWKDTFPDLKAVNRRRDETKVKSKPWKPCFNFAKGNCRYGDSCRYVHDANARVPNATSGFNNGSGTNENSTNELLNKLLAQLGKLGMNSTNTIAPTDPSFGAWNMDTGANSHLNNSTTSLSTVLNSCMYSTVSVGDGHSIPVTNTGHSILPTPLKSLRLNNVLITPHIDFMTRRVLLRCDSTGDLYPVIAPSLILHAFLVSQHTWHQRLGHPGSDVLCRLVSNNVISCNKEKPPVLCHACHL
ncbi:ribonuclease H-like domain-containing protein, partial [Tanacetum coccineum]